MNVPAARVSEPAVFAAIGFRVVGGDPSPELYRREAFELRRQFSFIEAEKFERAARRVAWARQQAEQRAKNQGRGHEGIGGR